MVSLLPNMLPSLDPSFGPLFFLAGPIDGGDDWQTKFCVEMRRHKQYFYAAVPWLCPNDHPLRSFQLHDLRETISREAWEDHYRERAVTSGCLIFWLPLESLSKPHQLSTPYAMSTMRDLQHWQQRLRCDPRLRIVVGAHPNFPDLDQIRRQFNDATESEFRIYHTMEDTALAAIAKATAK